MREHAPHKNHQIYQSRHIVVVPLTRSAEQASTTHPLIPESIGKRAQECTPQKQEACLAENHSLRTSDSSSFSATHRSQGAASLGVRHDLCPTPMEPKNNKTSFEASKISKHAKWQCVGRSAWLSFERRSRGNHNRRSPIVSETEELRWSPQTI